MKLAVREKACSGCRTCEVACALKNFAENNPKKSALRITGEFPTPGRYQIAYCSQCGTCAEVCPTGAISLIDGAYIIDQDTCIGCYVCVEACPNKAMFIHKDEKVPIKCTNCGACVQYCPREAVYDAEVGIKGRVG